MSHRQIIALTWLAASALPLVLAVVLMGCCALPFHGLVHRLLPLCRVAEVALTAHHHGEREGRQHPATPPAQKPDDQSNPRVVLKSEPRAAIAMELTCSQLGTLPPSILHRSQASPGAFRCDDDVGTRLARLDTLRI